MLTFRIEKMKQPDSATFVVEVEQAFGFLRDNGFTSSVADRTDTAPTAGLLFRGTNLATAIEEGEPLICPAPNNFAVAC